MLASAHRTWPRRRHARAADRHRRVAGRRGRCGAAAGAAAGAPRGRRRPDGPPQRRRAGVAAHNAAPRAAPSHDRIALPRAPSTEACSCCWQRGERGHSQCDTRDAPDGPVCIAASPVRLRGRQRPRRGSRRRRPRRPSSDQGSASPSRAWRRRTRQVKRHRPRRRAGAAVDGGEPRGVVEAMAVAAERSQHGSAPASHRGVLSARRGRRRPLCERPVRVCLLIRWPRPAGDSGRVPPAPRVLQGGARVARSLTARPSLRCCTVSDRPRQREPARTGRDGRARLHRAALGGRVGRRRMRATAAGHWPAMELVNANR